MKLLCLLLIMSVGILGARHKVPNIKSTANERRKQRDEVNRKFREIGIDSRGRKKLEKLRIVTGASTNNKKYSDAGLLVRTADELVEAAEPLTLNEIYGNGSCPYDTPPCDETYPYRTADGSCNNLKHPNWGRAGTPQVRLTNASYSDGISAPRKAEAGRELPSPRLVSTTVHEGDSSGTLSTKFTHLVMQWGQFLDHDITLTPTEAGEGGTDITCCLDDVGEELKSYLTQETLNSRSECFNIVIPKNDKHFKTTCMGFVRSVQAPNLQCTLGPVEQLNTITAFVDASNVYGSSQEQQDELREFSGGLLKITSDGLLPRGHDSLCTIEEEGEHCFDAGDERANEQTGLTCMHTIFVKEHNKIANQLAELNDWDDERIFQETRKIIGAMMQHVTYNEYLPHVIGPQRMKSLQLSPSLQGFREMYNEDTDPSIRNEFSTAAYRFGHSLVRGSFTRYSPIKSEKIELQDMFFRPNYLQKNEGKEVGYYFTGLRRDRCQKVDRFITTKLTNQLFQTTEGDSFDLASLNIQRGRDHGIPSYNALRIFCGQKPAESFDTKEGGLVDHSKKDAKKLKKVYRHPDDIDLFPGGLSEKPVKGGQVGPTFACIIGEQFKALTTGDRFWYENKGDVSFTLDQLNEIKKVTLATIMCRNGESKTIQPNVFRVPIERNSEVPCEDFEYMNMEAWKESP